MNGFPGLAQTRDARQAALDEVAQQRDNALALIRDINVRVPHVIENNLDPDDDLVGDLKIVYAIQPGVSEASDLNRARKLVSLWTASNTERAATVPLSSSGSRKSVSKRQHEDRKKPARGNAERL